MADLAAPPLVPQGPWAAPAVPLGWQVLMAQLVEVAHQVGAMGGVHWGLQVLEVAVVPQVSDQTTRTSWEMPTGSAVGNPKKMKS